MKKVLFAALMLVSAQGVFAQINKGQWLVGGNIAFESQKHGDAKATAFNISPNAGYFFINNFAGGLRASFSSVKPKNVDATTDLLIAPFVRYYFLPAAEKVNVFADAAYGFGSQKSGGESDGQNEFAITAGPAVFLSPNTALELGLYYKSAGGDAYGKDDRYNRFGFNIGFQVHLGNAKK